MRAYFTRAYTIAASHRLHTPSLSIEANRLTFGKCNNPFGHGHNYRIEVTVAGPIDAETGMVINMATLDAIVHQHVLARFDHQNLNLDPIFANLVSTTENLAIVIWDLLNREVTQSTREFPSSPASSLHRIRIEETENNFFEYFGRADLA